MIISELIFGTLKGLISPITGMIGDWQKRKAVKLEGDIAIATAKTNSMVKRLETGQQADIAWEQLSISKSGWRDDYWTIILSIPAVLVFIPGCVVYVRDGFTALSGMPGWYQWAIGIAIGSAFGYKRIADFMALKKGN